MKTVIIIFMIVSSISAIATLVYVAADVILERRKAKEPQEDPTHEPEPEIVESAPVVIPKDMPVPVSAKTGIEVIDVAWPESMAKNKMYKYTPNGEIVSRGDIVLVPTFDKHRHREILRTATVINGNYRVEHIALDKTPKRLARVIQKSARKEGGL